jgi:hypothetical protein
MRFANLKASQAFTWTSREAKALNNYRGCYIERRKARPESPDPYDDIVEFPVAARFGKGYFDGSKLPRGRNLLPALLWDRFQAVWIEDAPKSDGNW